MGRKAATIMRAPHDNENPYKAVRRATFEDSALSFEARGVVGYLLMKPDDWKIDIRDLMREGKIGRDKTYRILAELIEHGYLERVDERDRGQFHGASYLLHEQPLPEKPDTVAPLPEKPDTEKPDTEKPYPANPTHTNKEYSTKEEKSTKEGGGLRPPPPTPANDVDFGGEKLTPEQEMYAAICEAVGWDYKLIPRAKREQAAQLVIDLKKAGYTVADVRRYMVEVWFRDWRWEKKQERPRLNDIREGIGVLKLGLPKHIPRVTPAPTGNKAAANAAVVHNFFARIRESQEAQHRE